LLGSIVLLRRLPRKGSCEFVQNFFRSPP